MAISTTALKVGGGLAAAAATGTITFMHGQRNDATALSGDQRTWDKKVIGASLTTGAAALAGAALRFGTQGTPAAGVGAALGVGVLFGGAAGSPAGFIASMAID